MKSVVRVNNFTGKDGVISQDKNGKNPVYLTYISGSQLPEKARVLSGTIAENLGLEVGKSYIVNTEAGEVHPDYGQQYSHTVVAEMQASDLISLFSNELKTSIRSTANVEKAVPQGAEAK